MSTETFLEANKALWNQWAALHIDSDFYRVAEFRAGASTLKRIESAELTNVAGKSLLHLLCHLGLDTLSWARQGAMVTGVDLSDEAIRLAQELSAQTNLPARFICSSIYDLPNVLDETFDIVFTSYGVLHWLSDSARWGQIIARFLKPGGIFYIVEDHPMMRVFDSRGTMEMHVGNPYFFRSEPHQMQASGSYAAKGDEDTPVKTFYIWDHSLSEIINSLINAGLVIEFLYEFPFASRQKFPMLVQDAQGLWRMPGELDGTIPFLFSLQARKAVV